MDSKIVEWISPGLDEIGSMFFTGCVGRYLGNVMALKPAKSVLARGSYRRSTVPTWNSGICTQIFLTCKVAELQA